MIAKKSSMKLTESLLWQEKAVQFLLDGKAYNLYTLHLTDTNHQMNTIFERTKDTADEFVVRFIAISESREPLLE